MCAVICSVNLKNMYYVLVKLHSNYSNSYEYVRVVLYIFSKKKLTYITVYLKFNSKMVEIQIKLHHK